MSLIPLSSFLFPYLNCVHLPLFVGLFPAGEVADANANADVELLAPNVGGAVVTAPIEAGPLPPKEKAVVCGDVMPKAGAVVAAGWRPPPKPPPKTDEFWALVSLPKALAGFVNVVFNALLLPPNAGGDVAFPNIGTAWLLAAFPIPNAD